jgi:hypothetical protein
MRQTKRAEKRTDNKQRGKNNGRVQREMREGSIGLLVGIFPFRGGRKCENIGR